MTEPTEAVRAHRGGAYGPRQDERTGCRGGTRRRDRSHGGAALSTSGRPVADPPSAALDSVAVALRRLRDAAAAHDEDLPAAPVAYLNQTSARAA